MEIFILFCLFIFMNWYLCKKYQIVNRSVWTLWYTLYSLFYNYFFLCGLAYIVCSEIGLGLRKIFNKYWTFIFSNTKQITLQSYIYKQNFCS